MARLRKSAFRLIGFAAVSLITGSVFLAHLFRTETLDNPHLGVIQNKYRWGLAYEQLADSNRDGLHDFRAVFDGSSRSFSNQDQPVEFWEDRNYDGIFEIHALLEEGVVARVELDRDQDGKYDQVIAGREAEHFFETFFGPGGDGLLKETDSEVNRQ
ncbi:MAG: hypothetical protein GY722_04520 [bacterium]|nr:hypothetical protein [bacterium]